MNDTETIVCKPTPWFLFRALVMMVMFGVFATLFYLDGSTGYRKKNVAAYLSKTFEAAGKKFEEGGKGLTSQVWRNYAEKQKVAFPDDPTVVPATYKPSMTWPEALCDYERMKSPGWNQLWREYSQENHLDEKTEHVFDAGKIKGQWYAFWGCLALTTCAAFVLVRTLRRSITADEEAVSTAQGRRIPYADLKTLDLRKWDTKGLAFIHYDGSSGKGRIRIDGLTYGGFKTENQEPAERLMRRIRSHFVGELVEYATLTDPTPAAGKDSESLAGDESEAPAGKDSESPAGDKPENP